MNMFGRAVAAVILAVILLVPARAMRAGSLDLNLELYFILRVV